MPKPLALIVFLENVGHIAGLKLPQWAMNTVDFVTEEYAKALLHLYGAHRRYDRVLVLEDARATGPQLAAALLAHEEIIEHAEGAEDEKFVGWGPGAPGEGISLRVKKKKKH